MARLTVTTTVWNTKLSFLTICANSVIKQTLNGDFQWVILDNGSSEPAVVTYLEDLSHRYPFVKLLRVENNVGIIRGNRLCLEAAAGDYIVPLDSDDYLFPDALQILAYHIEKYGSPALLYSDEDKLDGKIHFGPYLKPDWDPILFLDSCYIAHVTAIQKEKALALGVYSQSDADGCHDWDTFCRFYAAGYHPVHVGELLYSWRFHPDSTTQNISSKDYIFSSHRAVLERYLQLAGHKDLQIAPSPLIKGTPDWWIRPEPSTLFSSINVITFGTTEDASLLAKNLGIDVSKILFYSAGDIKKCLEAPDDFPVLLWDRNFRLSFPGTWFEDLHALRKLFPDWGVIGGPTFGEDKRTLAAGYYFTAGKRWLNPDCGRTWEEPGYFSQMWKHHSVDAISASFCVVEKNLLRGFWSSAPSGTLADWITPLALIASQHSRRVIYNPFFKTEIAKGEHGNKAAIPFAAPLFTKKIYYHPMLSEKDGKFYQPQL